MLNLLIAIMGGSFESVSENAAPEVLKQRAKLLLQIIAEMPDDKKNLSTFPCWLHMLTTKGSGGALRRSMKLQRTHTY